MALFTPAPQRSLYSPARKALGQHFLVDGDVLRRILSAGDLSSDDTVLEVGPGRGVLTGKLLERVGQVIAVELDADLASSLSSRLGYPSNLTVLCGDARSVEFSHLLPPRTTYKVMANLPYYAANPIVRRFLERGPRPSLMVVMVQREVAQSMVAAPPRMGLLSVAVQFYGIPRLVCTVPAHAFRPPPKVESAVLRIDLRPDSALLVEDQAGFFDLVRAGFSAPRKQIRNSLSQGLGILPSISAGLLERGGVDSTRRPGTLTLEEWGRLYDALQET